MSTTLELARFILNAAEPEESAANAWRMAKELAGLCVSQDEELAAAQAEIARLRKLVDDAYLAGLLDSANQQRHNDEELWERSNVKEELDQCQCFAK